VQQDVERIRRRYASPSFVGIGERRAFDLVSETQVVKLGRLCRQADLDVAQTLAVGQLCKGHHAELLGTGKQPYVTAATMLLDESGECGPRQKIHQLGEQRLAGVHERLRVALPGNFFGSSF
jgi:hypothetical protein